MNKLTPDTGAFRHPVLVSLTMRIASVVFFSFFLTSCFSEEDHTERMTCENAASERGSAEAARKYAEKHSNSFPEVHLYIANSGFKLRNIYVKDNLYSFVYVFDSGFHTPCLVNRLSMIDTTLIIVNTSHDLKVLSVK